MRRLIPLLLGALLVALVTGCSSESGSGSASDGASAPDPAAIALVDTKWALIETYRTQNDLNLEPRISLAFEGAEAVTGIAGLNQYAGSYSAASDGTLTFSEVAATGTPGPEGQQAAVEEYLTLLGSVTSYSGDPSTLQLFAEGEPVLTYTANTN